METTLASCLAYSPLAVPLHAVADMTIFLACCAIATATLLYIHKKQPEFRVAGYVVAGVIFWIGLISLATFLSLWYPIHAFTGALKGVTALLLIIGSISLFPLMPRLIDILTPLEYEKVIRQLYDSNKLSEEAVEQNRTETKSLTRELSIRVRNIIATIHGISKETSRSTADIKTYLRKFNARLVGLTHCNDLLMANEWKGAPIRDVISSQLSQFEELDKAVVEGPDLFLKPLAVQNISLALHELAANTISHTDGTGSKNCTIRWAKHGEADEEGVDTGMIKFMWEESRPEGSISSDYKGFGSSVLNFIVPTALNGLSELKIHDKDIHWDLEVPVSSVC